jgi:hypothetical protein
MFTTELELKEYVEDLTRNNTCHRPDISCYDVCDDCPFYKYCLCQINTRFYKSYKKQKRKRSRRKK